MLFALIPTILGLQSMRQAHRVWRDWATHWLAPHILWPPTSCPMDPKGHKRWGARCWCHQVQENLSCLSLSGLATRTATASAKHEETIWRVEGVLFSNRLAGLLTFINYPIVFSAIILTFFYTFPWITAPRIKTFQSIINYLTWSFIRLPSIIK